MQTQLDDALKDLNKIKIALVGVLPEDQCDEVFQLERHENPDTLEEFTARLTNENFKQLVVCNIDLNTLCCHDVLKIKNWVNLFWSYVIQDFTTKSRARCWCRSQ